MLKMAVKNDDFDSLKIQFYVISSILGFLIVVLIAVVIHLAVKVHKLRRSDEEDDEEMETGEKAGPPPINPGFIAPKPMASRNWRDNPDIRRQKEPKDFFIPKPALTKNWQVFPDRSSAQPPRNFGNDPTDDELSNYSYDQGYNGRKSPTFKSSGSAFRNPLSANDSKRNFEWPDRDSKVKMPPNSGNNFNQGSSDYFGLRRERNNYY